MFSLKQLTLALLFLLGLIATLIPTIAAVQVTKEDADQGKVTGFTHLNASSHDGDYLASTFCYCGYGIDLNDTQYDEAHYFQFDYYNAHLNTTFIAQHFCSKRIDDKHTCFKPRSAEGAHMDNDLEFDWSGGVCKSWPRAHFTHGFTETLETVDEFCYWPHYANRKPDQMDDWIMFNGQKRDVSSFGHQGYRELQWDPVKVKCDDLCSTYHDMPVMEDNALAESRVVINDHVDDMCDSCK